MHTPSGERACNLKKNGNSHGAAFFPKRMGCQCRWRVLMPWSPPPSFACGVSPGRMKCDAVNSPFGRGPGDPTLFTGRFINLDDDSTAEGLSRASLRRLCVAAYQQQRWTSAPHVPGARLPCSPLPSLHQLVIRPKELFFIGYCSLNSLHALRTGHNPKVPVPVRRV